MKIDAKTILEIGLEMRGKLPDIYWDMDLNGSDLRVLRYVYNECLRLFKQGIRCVNGEDGSPRIWCSQTKMAENCKLSHVTFRKSVQKLQDMGILIKDTNKWPPSVYFIGIGELYITNIQDEKTFRHHSIYLKDILFYNSKEFSYYQKDKELNNYNSVLRTELQADKTPKQSIQRKSIIIGRVPIVTINNSEKLQACQVKLDSLDFVQTPEEAKVKELAKYYEFKCRKVLHTTGFRTLGKNAKESKNWKWYEKILELCSLNNWNPKVYIDSQFDRCKYWIRKQAYPYLNQMISENAKKYFPKYLQDYEQSHSVSGKIKAQSEKIKTTRQLIIDSVITDCENIINWITSAKKRKSNQGLSTEQLKVVYIAEHWMSLSAYYLSVIPWFIRQLLNQPKEPTVLNLQEEIQSIQKSSKLMEITKNIVDKVESNLGVPATLLL